MRSPRPGAGPAPEPSSPPWRGALPSRVLLAHSPSPGDGVSPLPSGIGVSLSGIDHADLDRPLKSPPTMYCSFDHQIHANAAVGQATSGPSSNRWSVDVSTAEPAPNTGGRSEHAWSVEAQVVERAPHPSSRSSNKWSAGTYVVGGGVGGRSEHAWSVETQAVEPGRKDPRSEPTTDHAKLNRPLKPPPTMCCPSDHQNRANTAVGPATSGPSSNKWSVEVDAAEPVPNTGGRWMHRRSDLERLAGLAGPE